MDTTLINTRTGPFRKTHATDAAETSFTAKVPKITAPTGDGVIDLGVGGAGTPNGLLLVPVGTGANNAVITGMRVIGWRRLLGDSAADLWVPIILAEFAAVFGNIPGVANSGLGSTYFFMDTITLVGTSGNANVDHEIVSPANDTMAHIVIDVKGSEKVEITFDLGANATGANCLYARI